MEQNYLKQIVIFLLLLFHYSIHAQPSVVPIGARAAGMGGIATVHTDVWSAVNNPGSLGLLNTFNVGIFHEQRFGMADMGVSSVVGAFPLFGNGVGLSLSNTGFRDYGENHFGIATGRKLGEFIAIGAGINGYMLRFPENYDNLFAVTGDVGIWANPIGAVTIGLHIANITFSKWNDSEHSNLPVVFSLGAGYRITTTIQLLAELSKDVYEDARLKIGTEFSILKALQLRMGVTTQPFQLHFGIGYGYKNFQFDAALSRHPVLGYSYQATIAIKVS